jgi:uncharacterized membrane protein
MKIFPNPTAETATVQFELETSSNVTIKLYNVQGKEIATGLNEILNAGTQQVQINVSNVEAGLYFVKVSSNNATSTVRLSVVR